MKHILSYLALFVLIPKIICIPQEVKNRFYEVNRSAPSIMVFFPENFPSIDYKGITKEEIKNILSNNKFKIAQSTKSFSNGLKSGEFNTLLLPFGSAFPLEAWGSIEGFINKGGNLIIIGGAPFHVPVWKDKQTGQWVQGIRTSCFAHKFRIGPAEKIVLSEEIKNSGKIKFYYGFGKSINKPFFPKATFALTIRLAEKNQEHRTEGSQMPFCARIRPLCHIVDKNQIPRHCTTLEIDWIKGKRAGARWIFIPCLGYIPKEYIKEAIKRVVQGASSLEAYPDPASLYKGEKLRLKLLFYRPRPWKKETITRNILIKIFSESNEIVYQDFAVLKGQRALFTDLKEISSSYFKKPGFYKIGVFLENYNYFPRKVYTGIWFEGKSLFKDSPRISVSKDWIRKGKTVLPIIGTTYMGRLSHRKFLLFPNPFNWEKDISNISKAGINYIRTGIWFGWERYSGEPGDFDEGCARALEAFALSCAKKGIIVCFTFFAFVPPLFGGTNSYLDSTSITAQKYFIEGFCRRLKGIPYIQYDLINEPSYAPERYVWHTRPFGDDTEKENWKKWLMGKYKEIPLMSSLFRTSEENIFDLPNNKDFETRRYIDDRNPWKAYEFILFSQNIFSNWASDLRQRIIGLDKNALVTVGQDEGGMFKRPSPQFFFNSVDYTCVHTWWLDDDILWDCLMSKIPEKPNLVEETGLMRLEDIEGWHWYNPDNCARILERKFALSFAGRCAGAVEWIWNINPYLPIDNESVIGIFRPDGTAKPEYDVLKRFGVFFKEAGEYLDDFNPSQVVLIIPHSRLFLGLRKGIDGTRNLIRILSDYYGIIPTCISEFKVSTERLEHAKLIILPEVDVLTFNAAKAIVSASKKGKTVFVIGSIKSDPFGRISDDLKKLGAQKSLKPLSLYEKKGDDFVYMGRDTIRAFKKGNQLELGRNIIFEPVPLCSAERNEYFINKLGKVLDKAGVQKNFSKSPISTSVHKMINGNAFIVFVNESNSVIERKIDIGKSSLSFKISPRETKLLIFDVCKNCILVSSK